jgi:hypothetical protein
MPEAKGSARTPLGPIYDPLPAQPANKTTDRHVPLVIRIVSSKKNGYIQNMFHCLNIKNLQYFFLMIFFLLSILIVGGWVENPIGKFQLDFLFLF